MHKRLHLGGRRIVQPRFERPVLAPRGQRVPLHQGQQSVDAGSVFATRGVFHLQQRRFGRDGSSGGGRCLKGSFLGGGVAASQRQQQGAEGGENA